MNKEDNSNKAKTEKSEKQTQATKRSADSLRANLRRRKQSSKSNKD